MPRLYYVHWNRAEALETVRRLRSWGHVVRYNYEQFPQAGGAGRAT